MKQLYLLSESVLTVMKSLKGPIPAAAEPAVVPEPAAPGSVAAAILEACT